jgi:uncharacterized protein (DUF3820 family)
MRHPAASNTQFTTKPACRTWSAHLALRAIVLWAPAGDLSPPAGCAGAARPCNLSRLTPALCLAMAYWLQKRDLGNNGADTIIALARLGISSLTPFITKAVADMSPRDLELLVTREMPFGMHKGRIIADLPGNYLNWFARKGFPAGEIGRLLALMQEIDHNGLTDILTPLRQRSGNLPGRSD